MFQTSTNLAHGLQFEYAIRYPNGKFYTGRVTSPEEPNAHQGESFQAFTYTEAGAHAKIDQDRTGHFAGCTVVHVI